MFAANLVAADVSYKRPSAKPLVVLKSFDFKVEQGEVVAILGASGSGKSSLLRVLAGQERLASGSVEALGAEPRQGVRTGRIAFASPDAPLLPWRDTASNGRLLLDLIGRDRSVADEAVQQLLTLLKIDHVSGHRPGQLSDGQCQRLRLVQALSTSPDLLLLDEPFNSCDEGLRSQLADIVSRFVREQPHRAAVLVTHFAFEAAALANRIVIVAGPRLFVVHEQRLLVPPAQRDEALIMRIAADTRPHLLRAASEYRSAV